MKHGLGEVILDMVAREAETQPALCWCAVTYALTLGAVATTAAAMLHIGESLLRGPICGTPSDGHCWACYAAPILAALAVAAWRESLRVNLRTTP